MEHSPARPLVAIACGGTGGHLFPGVAVGEALVVRGVEVTLLVSPKEVDQQAVKTLRGLGVATLPAVGLSGRDYFAFLRGAWRSHRAAEKLFRARPPLAVLAMGGFTSAPPVLAGRRFGAATFLHESNTIPGRANRWLARVVDEAFVYFPETASRLRHPRAQVVGMPVRPQFRPRDPGPARRTRGLDADRPTLLVTGGSQGASGLNDLVLRTLPNLSSALPELQFIHLTGPNDAGRVQAAYDHARLPAAVHPFLAEMDIAMAAATVALTRAGASSLAETAAMRLPSILVPYPFAADDHQRHNARAFAESGAARLLEQHDATPEQLVRHVVELIRDQAARVAMQSALAKWHMPDAAEQIAGRILHAIGAAQTLAAPAPPAPARSSADHEKSPDQRVNSNARSSLCPGGDKVSSPTAGCGGAKVRAQPFSRVRFQAISSPA